MKLTTASSGSTLSNQELTQTAVAEQANKTLTNSTTMPTAVPTRTNPYLAIALDPENGRDDVNCISMNISNMPQSGWYLSIRGAPVDPAVFDAAGNARICSEWIAQQPGFYVDVVYPNFEPVERGSAPGVGGDIFKSRWVVP